MLYVLDTLHPEMFGEHAELVFSKITEDDAKKLFVESVKSNNPIYSRLHTQKISSLLSSKVGKLIPTTSSSKPLTQGSNVDMLWVYYVGPALEKDSNDQWPTKLPEGGELRFYHIQSWN